MSETAKHRDVFLAYCRGNGLDIGYGGDPIVDSAIALDQISRYSYVGSLPQHLAADARDLYMFADNALDYVYSSHCIEDFEDTAAVLREWARVVRPGGHLCLLFPDEQVYRRRSRTHNQAHVHLNFGLQFVRERLPNNTRVVLERELFEGNDYNCALVLQKC